MDQVFNSGTEEDFIQRARDSNAGYFGVFEQDEMIALVIVEMPVPTIHEGHLLAKRGADRTLITSSCITLISDLLNIGMTHAFIWVAERHTGLKQICVTMGFRPDGVVQWRGSYHGRAIKWVRYSLYNEQAVRMTQAA